MHYLTRTRPRENYGNTLWCAGILFIMGTRTKFGLTKNDPSSANNFALQLNPRELNYILSG